MSDTVIKKWKTTLTFDIKFTTIAHDNGHTHRKVADSIILRCKERLDEPDYIVVDAWGWTGPEVVEQ